MDKINMPFSRHKKEKKGWFKTPIRYPDGRRVALAVIATVLLWAVMALHFIPDRVTLKIGDIIPSDIRAPRSVTYLDHTLTRKLQEEAAARVPRAYSDDPAAIDNADHSLAQSINVIQEARSAPSKVGGASILEHLSYSLGVTLTPAEIHYLLYTTNDNIIRFQNYLNRLVNDQMSRDIRNDTDDLKYARADLKTSADRIAANPEEANLLYVFGSHALRPNMVFDQMRTNLRREAAERSVAPVIGQIKAGDIVLRQGDVFTLEQLDKCTALGLMSPHLSIITALSLGILAFLMVMLIGIYIRFSFPLIYQNYRMLLLLTGTVLMSVFGLKIFGSMLGISFSGVQMGYMGMITVTAAGMLLTVLINPQIAILVTALLSVQSGIMLQHEIRFPLITFFSSLTGIYCVLRIQRRMQLIRTILIMAGVNLLLVWMLGGLLGDSLRDFKINTAWAIVAAIISVGIFWICVTVLEKPFDILTHVWLLELSSSEQPLLRKLCLTAPATYAHSIMVGNLAEAAGEAIGADALFCRVASYYHDVGKIRRPQCYVENQRNENIHDHLNPSLSALIIASHVREGIELAEEYKLPAQFKAVIAEHHGTSLIRYFYHQALHASGLTDATADPILQEHFRYDGPRPQTRESGIIMLADSVEAAARTLDKPSPARLKGLVEAIIHDKLTDGQLDECDLTFKDIARIQSEFVKILTAMLHGRIDYPALPGSKTSYRSDMDHAITSDAHRYPEYTSVAGEQFEHSRSGEKPVAL